MVATARLRSDGGRGDQGDPPEALTTSPGAASDRDPAVDTQEIMQHVRRPSGDLDPLHTESGAGANAGFPRTNLLGHGTAKIA